jgi:hypothetical protein
MYEIVDPGGWNLEAVEGGQGFIPAVNEESVSSAGSPPAIPAREMPPLPPDAPLLDPARAGRITITGLMSREDQAKAEAMALKDGEGSAAVYDEEAGWLLIPRPASLPAKNKAAP